MSLTTPDTDVTQWSVKQYKKHPVKLFSHLPPTSLTPVVNLGLGISSRNLDKFKMMPSAEGARCFLKKALSKKTRDSEPLSALSFHLVLRISI